MSIRLNVEVDDDNTEHLIAYLDNRLGGWNSEKRRILEAALKWMDLKHPEAYKVELMPQRASIVLAAEGTNQEVDFAH